MRVIYPDGCVSVIDDIERAALIFKPQGREIGLLSTLNVNGRLLLAGIARSVRWIEATPMFRSVCAFVAPRCPPRTLSGCGGLRLWTAGFQDRRDNQTKCHPTSSQDAPRFR